MTIVIADKDLVTLDRDKYIGGSDISIILNINSFTTKWKLLQFKAGLIDNEFSGNKYTEYGDLMEPVIREHINEFYGYNFAPDQRIIGDLRANTDGYDKTLNGILEIKTTSQIHSHIEDYKHYIVQMLFYMEVFKADGGMLAVYERPDDFSTEFDPSRLNIFTIEADEFPEWQDEIVRGINSFRADLKYLKENPFATENELPSMTGLSPIATELEVVEAEIERLAYYKKREEELRAELLNAMINHGVKKWTTDSGIAFTVVNGTPDKLSLEFNEKKFMKDHPDLVEEYTVEKIRKGRGPYLKITLPKEG